MSGMRKAMADETRSRILATARRLFTDKGYFATGTTEIVQAAEVGTRGALYHHFANKEQLFTAVLEEIEVELAGKVRARIEGGSAMDQLRSALNGFLDYSLDPEVRRILLVDGPAVLGWGAWRGLEAQHGLGSIRRLLQAGVDEGSVQVTDIDSMAHLLLSAIDEAALFIANADDSASARAGAGSSVSQLISGIAVH